MFEHIKQDDLLNDALSKVPNDVDKREGSIIYDALAPHSIQLYELYLSMDGLLREMFGDTATREFLIKLCLDRGIVPEPATNAVLKGVFNIDVPIGSRFNLDSLNYVITEKISDGIFKLKCETPGTVGNNWFGPLIPVNYIDGLQSAALVELLIPGEDEEATEDLRKRYLESFDSQAYGGNRKDYQEKVHDLQGVGGVKGYRVKNDIYNVKLVIMDTNFNSPTSALLEELQTAIDPETNHGEGMGIAPIGHVVNVVGVTEVPVNITFNLIYDTGYDWSYVENEILTLLDEYFLDLKKNWESSQQLTVRISHIESRVLEIEGIIDISNTLINNLSENLILGQNDIPTRGIISE
ncbi:baseplate J/gp47 family protein [Cytobacillus massiliigabonensis]|uniref:baseplate J/gp47 family protein n=1 Tax=Cytobacillus massiliigabonensis TaxID=1871011 RepID=UPI000C860A45|nr:baseplate J/gp47 family protein [Cytobacillus massiliigabonensis]